MLAYASKSLVLAGFTALALSTSACSALKSDFACGPAAYRNGPSGHDNQPMKAMPCDGNMQVAGWAVLATSAPSSPVPAQANPVPESYTTYPSHVAWQKPAANGAACARLTEAQAEGGQSGYVVYPSHVAYYGNCRPAS